LCQSGPRAEPSLSAPLFSSLVTEYLSRFTGCSSGLFSFYTIIHQSNFLLRNKKLKTTLIPIFCIF
jgi:hypothetical protein